MKDCLTKLKNRRGMILGRKSPVLCFQYRDGSLTQKQ
ncbi:hypothetical protein E2C01_074182 [Portunus trituberculatus]|uniref:Uncharacterized protein n=1 Tax=Portunus trituberculatus TaxID=210409 RepID=A0A5B7IGF9_PORTR|nr:hypothetical protein [Portunus trituberculatus]